MVVVMGRTPSWIALEALRTMQYTAVQCNTSPLRVEEAIPIYIPTPNLAHG